MVRYLIITARNRQELFAYLRQQFSTGDSVRVLLDRRRKDRRRCQELHEPERRRGDRRSQSGKDYWLPYYGLLVIRQLPETGWQPLLSEPNVPEKLGFDSSSTVDSSSMAERTNAITDRERVAGWVKEGQRLIQLVSMVLQKHQHFASRTEAAERRCNGLEDEVRGLRAENEYLRRERRQIANSLNALTKQLIESAGGEWTA